ncbi:nuclear transport factor 2 family protein [Novosphingobium malaysiense]|uniref:SnoaL-like domain-containing protein n=1 Tax=Novosphingobium malaysiense TaxID=1348853 RepID=A0A0B1ZI20_9SPHN|nr:nuclear transport factor 2 family protein [Novosphingobium malaysiense]KHK88992.1 hypothetical protein LK12_23175 [Novosphingobium malaysiense]
MTIEEMLAREAIRYTLACYNVAGDRGRFDEMIAQFTEDGVLELPDGTRHEGRDAIRASIFGVGQRAEGESRPVPAFVRHHISTSQIEFTGPETASGRTYFNVYTNVGLDHCGFYSDTLRKTGERWLLIERKARLDWASPQSVMASAPSR